MFRALHYGNHLLVAYSATQFLMLKPSTETKLQ